MYILKPIGIETSASTASTHGGSRYLRVTNNTAGVVLATISNESGTVSTMSILPNTAVTIEKFVLDEIAFSAAVLVVPVAYN